MRRKGILFFFFFFCKTTVRESSFDVSVFTTVSAVLFTEILYCLNFTFAAIEALLFHFRFFPSLIKKNVQREHEKKTTFFFVN